MAPPRTAASAPLTRRRLLASGLALGPATALWAPSSRAGQPGVDEPPPAGPPRPLKLPSFHEHWLANGLRLVVVPQPALPLVTAALHLRPGGHADPAGRTGLASLTASLRPKGARHGGRLLGAAALARLAESLGGGLDSSADGRGTSVGSTVATPRLAAAAALLLDVALHPRFAADELALLRSQAADSLRFSLADPMGLAAQVARRVAWGDSVLGASLTLASLRAIQTTDAIALHRRQARPNGSTLVLAGDLTPEAGLALAERLLGSWQVADPAAAPSPPTAGRGGPPATVLVNLPGAGQCAVIVMAPAVAADSPERRVAQVATAVLGGGYSSRLNVEVRVRRGLSYGASAGLELQAPGGWLQAQTQTDHRHAAEVVQVLHAEIRRLGQAAPPAEELQARQASLVGGFARQLESTAGLAGLALDRVARGLPLSEVAQVADALRAVTAAEVADFAQRHWAQAQLRTVVVGDLAAAGPALRSWDADALVLEAAALQLDAASLQR